MSSLCIKGHMLKTYIGERRRLRSDVVEIARIKLLDSFLVTIDICKHETGYDDHRAGG